MFDDESKLILRMAPRLQRVLIVDHQPPSARLVGDLMRTIARSQIWIAGSAEKAMRVADVSHPQLIFVGPAHDELDGLAFTRRLRRSTMAARKAPVVMMASQATAGEILAARDAGVHEFLRKPFTTRELLRRLEAVTLHDREWVEAMDYIGPDRRRFNSGDYSGPLKRRSDAPSPDAARITQALKILRSAVLAAHSDPGQALRAMLAQAVDIEAAATAAENPGLAQVARNFHDYLAPLTSGGDSPNFAELERRAAPLLLYMPKDAARRGARAA